MGDVTQNLITADRLVKAGVFKTGPDTKTQVRDAFLNASVGGLVSVPFSIASYAGSVAAGETIKGAYTPSAPVLPPAHLPAPSQQSKEARAAVESASTQEAKQLEVRLDTAESHMLLTANTIQKLAGGDEALGKSENWPTEPNARLDEMEQIYDSMESSLKKLAEENDFICRPYKDDSTASEKTPTSRLDVLAKRNEKIQVVISRILTVLEVESVNAPSPQPTQFA